MTDEDVTKFDEYWRTITRNEEFIRQHGHNTCPDWEGCWHTDLENAYSNVRPALSGLTRRRMFHELPGGLNPFEAENCHHALVLFLNPPERWFGNVGVLHTPEYLALKERAEEEEIACNAEQSLAERAPTRTDDLSESERVILAAIDDTPRQGPEIAARISKGLDSSNIRRELSQLRKRGYIGHQKGKGYFRL